MEVAMIRSHRRSRLALSRCARITLLAGCGLALVGCADMVADSTPSRQAANGLYTAGNYDEAAGAYRNATRQDPRDYKAQYGLACSYDQLHQYQQAVQAYKTTLDVMTRTLAGQEDKTFRAQVIDSLASCIARSNGRGVEIAALAQQAAKSHKAEDYYILAKANAYIGDADSALDAYNRAALLEPRNFDVARDFGLYLQKIGQTQRAGQQLTRAHDINPTDAQVNNALRQLGITPRAGAAAGPGRGAGGRGGGGGAGGTFRWVGARPPRGRPAAAGAGGAGLRPAGAGAGQGRA
jgi:tetratricopeptide (TPR) repeat protein